MSLDDWGMGRRPSWIKVVALVMALLYDNWPAVTTPRVNRG